MVESLAGVDPQEWNALAGEQPFVRHEFLSALVETGCAVAQHGWLPRRQEVLAYCQAPASEGGSGALLILLKSKR